MQQEEYLFSPIELGKVADTHAQFVKLVADIADIGKKLTYELGYEEYAVSIRKNVTKSEINYPIEFHDIPYPFDKNNGKDRMVSNTIAVLKEKSNRSTFPGCVEIKINEKMLSISKIPEDATIKERYQRIADTNEQELTGYSIFIKLGTDEALKFVETLIRYRLEHYVSSFPDFGCCHLYQECSKARKCLQFNRSYSGACQYKRNLDAGIVFYDGVLNHSKLTSWGLQNYTIIDIETTGLNPYFDGITELAAVRVRNGEIVDRFQELVNPGMPIPHFLEEKTHITNEMVRRACPTCEVLARFLEFIGSDILMGYNIDRFDKEFIKEKVRSELHAQFNPQTCDVFPLARRAFRGRVKSFKLDSLRELFNIDSEGSHRALKDCCDTYSVYQQILRMPRSEVEYDFLTCHNSRRDRTLEQREETKRHKKLINSREREIMSWFPQGFQIIEKSYIPTDVRERWEFVRKNPFTTLSGANVVITGSSDIMPRSTAERIVNMVGATLKYSATRDCDFLIDLGNGGNTKYENACKWIHKGSPLRIINDKEFINLVHASISETPPSSEQVDILMEDSAKKHSQRVADEQRLKDRIKDNLKNCVTDEELHNWRQEFFELWNHILEDDIIEPRELIALREWLLNHMRKTTDYKSMFALVDCVIADGIVDYEESIKLFDEVKKCLITMGAVSESL